MADDTTPVIILAFANDQDDYLKNIQRERKGVYEALRPQNDRRSIDVYKEEETSTEDLFKLFTLYGDRIAIFHYGGHASGTGLRLETVSGAAEQANATGLAQLLGMQKGLKLVFLNGCATGGQVKTLLAHGVKAVIATAVPINDQMATEFAEQFYNALANRSSIDRAFDTARAFISTRYGAGQKVGTFRGGFDTGEETPETTSAGMTWGLYLNDDADDVLAWALPEPPGSKVVIRNAPPVIVEGSELSTALIEATMKAIEPYNPFIAFALKKGDRRTWPQLLSDSYPSPVGEQLRRVFASRAISITRLRLLVLAYEVIAKLACFTALSQLWNARLARPDLVISDQQRVTLNSFMTLTKDSQPTFDYFKLTITIVEILADNGVEPFMVECQGLGAELTDEPTTQARQFMDEMRRELHGNRVPDAELGSFCAQAEKHLTTLLVDFKFIVNYQFTTIKNIDIVKNRNKDPITKMRTVKLDNVSTELPDEISDITTFIDVNSVVLQKDREDLQNYLNLTPFLIDENAIIGAASSKLFFYDYHDDDDNFHFASVNDNMNDRLIVSDKNYPDIKNLCKEFRDAVFRK